MKTYTSLDTFNITGRGKVFTVTSPAGEEIPVPGEHIVLDGVTVEVRGVERHGLPMEVLVRRDTPLGLMIRPLQDTIGV